MIVVADSSPIIYLSWIGRVELLRQLFSEVIVPPTVYHEVAVAGENRPGSVEISSLDWIRTSTSVATKLPKSIAQELDLGETEAIELAIEVKADYLLMDEQRGRKVAKDFGLTVVGVLGVLIRAKEKGFIDSVKEDLTKLTSDTNFYISNEMVQQILELANEK